VKRSNRLQTTKLNNRMVNDYWEDLFRAPEEGRLVCWYEGVAINPILQAADIAWCHGEAMSALLAARREEGPSQKTAEDRGYDRELCSYARTHIGCGIMTQQSPQDGLGALPADPSERKSLAERMPLPDMIISAYPFCSTGQQWDDMLQHLPALDLGQQSVRQVHGRARVPRACGLPGQAAARVHQIHREHDGQTL
jgi:benzoyl-CoA reductase subunit B